MQPPAAIWRSRENAWQAMPSGGVHRLLAQGEGGFWAVEFKLPPHGKIATHAVNQEQIVYVIEGTCVYGDNTALEKGDTIVIHAGKTYGFVAGSEGMSGLVVRP